MSTSHLKALVLGLAVLGYVALIEVASYVLSRRFQALRIAQD
jgi:hypothetical protein